MFWCRCYRCIFWWLTDGFDPRSCETFFLKIFFHLEWFRILLLTVCWQQKYLWKVRRVFYGFTCINQVFDSKTRGVWFGTFWIKNGKFWSAIKTCDKFPICEIVRYEDLVLRPNEILPKLIESYRYQKLYIPPRFKFNVSWANKSVTSWNRTLPEGIDQVRHQNKSL